MYKTCDKTQPGFQGSETSWCEATFYRHGDDPIVLTPAERLPATGRRPQDTVPSLISISTSKALGAASGNFVIQMKPSKAVNSLFEQLVDDDWVDITIYRHAQGWHTMRGLVDEIRRTRSVGGTGATSELFTVSGRDFGKVWEITPVWFSPYANDLVSTMVASQVFGARAKHLGNPGVAVRALLSNFLEAIANVQGPDWELPQGVPGVLSGAFLENITFQVGAPYFQNLPGRQAYNPGGFMAIRGTLWSLAQQFGDPMFTELYADLLPDGDPFSGRISAGDPLGPRDMKMTLVLRDKPFPVVDSEVIGGAPNPGYKHPWARVPLLTVPRQQIVSSDLGRSGLERFNAYMVAPVVYQETMGVNALEIMAPLLDRVDLQRHGFRRMDVSTNMVPEDKAATQYYDLANWQRRVVRDWYCLNPYMLNGSISLGIGRPDIRIGCRVIIPAEADDDQDETYYVEQVSHNWSFGTSVKTNLGVTRGWRGDDDSYIGALETQSFKYRTPDLKLDPQVTPPADPGIGSA